MDCLNICLFKSIIRTGKDAITVQHLISNPEKYPDLLNIFGCRFTVGISTVMTDVQMASVGKLKFSQDSIKGEFSDGRSLDQCICDINDRYFEPYLEVVWIGDSLVSLDNRRLWCLKRTKRLYVLVKVVPVDENTQKKLTSKNRGASVKIRRRSLWTNM